MKPANKRGGRWAVDLGGVCVRRPTLTSARRTAAKAGGIVRRWRRSMHVAPARYGWEHP